MIKREPGTVDPSEYNWKDHFALEGIIEPFIKMDVGKVRGLAIAVEELQAENKRLLADNRRIMDENLRLLDDRAKWQIKAERLKKEVASLYGVKNEKLVKEL